MMPLYVLFVAVYVIVALVVMYYLFGKSMLQDCEVKSVYKKLVKYHSRNILDAAAISLEYNQLLKNDYHILYVDFLERFLIYIHENDLEKEQIISLTAIINPILQKSKEEEPYVYLDKQEKHLLIAIEKTAQHGETISLKKHMGDLSEILLRKQKDLDNARKTNWWTIPISIIGLVLSLIGLLISLSLNQ